METETSKTQNFEWTTAKGSKITLTVETTATPEIAYCDGYNIPTGKIIETQRIAVTVNGKQLAGAGFWQGHIEGRMDGQRMGVMIPDDVKAALDTPEQREASFAAFAAKMDARLEALAKRDAEQARIDGATGAADDRYVNSRRGW